MAENKTLEHLPEVRAAVAALSPEDRKLLAAVQASPFKLTAPEQFKEFAANIDYFVFQTLKEIRIKIADKLSRVPMGYIMDQSSGRFKDVIVDRVESMEPILAHLVPEMTSNLFVPLCIIVYLFVLDWRMALASLVTLPIGFLCYMGMSRGYSERFSGLMKRVQKMNATIIEYGATVCFAIGECGNHVLLYSVLSAR